MRREPLSFEEFLAARLPALTRYATALAGDPGTGADVLQDVLVKVQPRWSRIVSLDAPESYVRWMVINELISARRRIVARVRRLTRPEATVFPQIAGGPGGGRLQTCRGTAPGRSGSSSGPAGRTPRAPLAGSPASRHVTRIVPPAVPIAAGAPFHVLPRRWPWQRPRR
ncbi:sigma factor [Dactylosporangium sp. NPDC005572]|uniref:sigma factor n=1 Tax=Dactylosporangium sp. NPDC005572 TaxID=3156889 RepID=UPI0033AE24AB